MISDQAEARRRHQRGAFLDEFMGVAHNLAGPVVPASLQGEGDPLRVQPLQASGGQHGSLVAERIAVAVVQHAAPLEQGDEAHRRLLDEPLHRLVSGWVHGHEGRLAGQRIGDIDPSCISTWRAMSEIPNG